MRAMWKGIILLGEAQVPVKIYAEVESKGLHFRLLHAEDGVPVKGRMVDSSSGQPVTSEEVRRAYPLEEQGSFVLLREEELAALAPPASREILLGPFLARERIDHQWYDRPYFLGPDGDPAPYFALLEALGSASRVGFARWVMRKKKYYGVVMPADGHLRLTTLRTAAEVLTLTKLRPPESREPAKEELRLAEQLVAALEGPFEPERYQDEYRKRVEELIAAKARGQQPKFPRREQRPAARGSLTDALTQSIQRAKEAGVA